MSFHCRRLCYSSVRLSLQKSGSHRDCKREPSEGAGIHHRYFPTYLPGLPRSDLADALETDFSCVKLFVVCSPILTFSSAYLVFLHFYRTTWNYCLACSTRLGNQEVTSAGVDSHDSTRENSVWQWSLARGRIHHFLNNFKTNEPGLTWTEKRSCRWRKTFIRPKSLLRFLNTKQEKCATSHQGHAYTASYFWRSINNTILYMSQLLRCVVFAHIQNTKYSSYVK